MKYSLVLLASTATAFPFMAPGVDAEKRAQMMKKTFDESLGRRAVEAAREYHQGKRQLGGIGGGLLGGVLQPLSGALEDIDIPTPQAFGLKEIPGDDPDHQFQAPSSTDVRGLCPTLNTLANHGFLSRDGITTFAEASNAVQTAYGFGYGLSTFLSALGLIAGGDLLSGKYSIGGADSRVPNTLGPALGIAKHGTFEIDGSISRPDNYFGNQANFIPDRWKTIRQQAIDNGGGFFGAEMWIANQQATYETARSTNPEFDAGVKYFAVSLAERAFMFRGLPNGTHVETADAANIEPFFLLNTFPHDWFRRATPYELDNLALDLVHLYAGFPFQLGQNMGENDFVPLDIDLGNKTPSDLMCFILTNIFDTVPGQVQPTLASSLSLYEDFVAGVVSPFFGDFACSTPETFTAPGKSCQSCDDAAPSADDPDDGAGELAKSIPAPGKPLTSVD